MRDKDLPAMDSWLSWWEVRIAHWGNVMTTIEGGSNGPETPTTNLSESKHGSWFAGEGFRKKISLYDACTSDLANAVLQSLKANSYLQGKHLGSGPSLVKLAQRNNVSPSQVVQSIGKAATGTPMYKRPAPLSGDKETIRHKRPMGVVIDVEDESSHRPEYNYHTRDRKLAGQPRKIQFTEEVPIQKVYSQTDKEVVEVVETKVNEACWAIRRTPLGSKVTCMGTSDGRRRCGTSIPGCYLGIPTASFESFRNHPRGVIKQWMWFCPNHVLHCKVVDANIDPSKAWTYPKTLASCLGHEHNK